VATKRRDGIFEKVARAVYGEDRRPLPSPPGGSFVIIHGRNGVLKVKHLESASEERVPDNSQ
jgi:hypothetical protein